MRAAALVVAFVYVFAGCGAEPAPTTAPDPSSSHSPSSSLGSSPSTSPRGTSGPPTPQGPSPAAEPIQPMDPSTPVRVRIPAIGVDSNLMDLGLQPDGTMEVPPGAFPAGWYTGAPTPGELGPAIIAGHVNVGADAGVFAELNELRRGDEIVVTRADGSKVSFAVTAAEEFVKTAFPTRRVYGNIDHAGLRLITCGGLNQRSDAYETNIVVFAALERADQRG